MSCEISGCVKEAKVRRSMTCYVDAEGNATKELNPRPVLCDEHWEEYMEHWEAMWAEYRSSLGV